MENTPQPALIPVIHASPEPFDLDALTTFGVSIKSDADSAIGQFGTGFKYATAVLLRNGARISLWDGDRATHSFFHKPVVIRGESRNIIHYRDHATGAVHKLGFTTALGKDWPISGAFRELHSNALDERGTTWVPDHEPKPADLPRYRVKVEGLVDYESCALNRDEMFIDSTKRKLLVQIGGSKVYIGPTQRIYCRGVSVWQLATPLPFTVDLGHTWLTEDRTATNPELTAAEAIEKITRGAAILINRATDSGADRFKKRDARKGWAMLNVLLKLRYAKALDFASVGHDNFLRTPEFYEAAARLSGKGELYAPRLRRALLERQIQRVEGGRAPTAEEQNAIDAVMAQLLTCDLNLSEPHEIRVASSKLLPGALGLANPGTGRVMLNEKLFGPGREIYLFETLLEEVLHITTGVRDETRAMQDWLLAACRKLWAQMKFLQDRADETTVHELAEFEGRHEWLFDLAMNPPSRRPDSTDD